MIYICLMSPSFIFVKELLIIWYWLCRRRAVLKQRHSNYEVNPLQSLQPPQGLCSTLKLLTIHRAQVLAKLELFGTHKQAHFQNKIKYSDFWLLLLHKGTVEINQSPFEGSVLPVDLNYGLIIIYYLRCQTPPVSSCVIVLSFHPTPAAGFLGWVRKMF